MKMIIRALALLSLVCGFSLSAVAEIYAVHSDHLGTPVKLTDSDKRVVWSAVNRGFGEGVYNADPDGDGRKVDMPLRYPGQYFDKESGLHYNYFRYYDPTVGRYITSDPIGLAGGINTYGYAGGNPVSYVDWYGLSPKDVARIQEIANQVVKQLTEDGHRVSPYLGNNARRNIETWLNGGELVPYDEEKFGHNLQCSEQTYRVINKLRSVTDFDDKWIFDAVDNAEGDDYDHTWGRARSDNQNDPTVYFDPFWNKTAPSSCVCADRKMCGPCAL